jgi:hypothetical protein
MESIIRFQTVYLGLREWATKLNKGVIIFSFVCWDEEDAGMVNKESKSFNDESSSLYWVQYRVDVQTG